MIHETGDGYGILTNIQQRNIHSLILFCVLCVLVFNTTNTQRAVSYERWWKTFCRNRTNRKWDGLLIQAKTHRRTQARAQRYLNTYLTLLSSVFLSQLHTQTLVHKGSWLSGGDASQADCDVCAGVRRWCASKRSQEKYDEASLQVLCVCSQACMCGRVCCFAASFDFYPHPLSGHNKHGWIRLSGFEEYDTSMFMCCTLTSLIHILCIHEVAYTPYQYYQHIIFLSVYRLLFSPHLNRQWTTFCVNMYCTV